MIIKQPGHYNVMSELTWSEDCFNFSAATLEIKYPSIRIRTSRLEVYGSIVSIKNNPFVDKMNITNVSQLYITKLSGGDIGRKT